MSGFDIFLPPPVMAINNIKKTTGTNSFGDATKALSGGIGTLVTGFTDEIGVGTTRLTNDVKNSLVNLGEGVGGTFDAVGGGAGSGTYKLLHGVGLGVQDVGTLGGQGVGNALSSIGTGAGRGLVNFSAGIIPFAIMGAIGVLIYGVAKVTIK